MCREVSEVVEVGLVVEVDEEIREGEQWEIGAGYS